MVAAGCDAGGSPCRGRAEVYKSGWLGSGGIIEGSLVVSGHDHYVYQMHSNDCMSQRFGLNWNSGRLRCDVPGAGQGGSCGFSGSGRVRIAANGSGGVTVSVSGTPCCSSTIARDVAYCVRFGDYVAWNISSSHSTQWSDTSLQ